MSNKKFNVKNGLVVGNNVNANVDVHIGMTDAVQMPSGTTAQRPGTENAGQYRYNQTTSEFEYRDNAGWASVSNVVAASVVYADLASAAVESNVAANSSSTIPTTVAAKKYADEINVEFVDLASAAVESNVAANTSSTIPTTPAVKAYMDGLGGGGAGSLEYITTANAVDNQTVEFYSLNDANYVHYRIIGYDLSCNVAASIDPEIHLRTSTSNGSSFDSGGSNYGFTYYNANTTDVYQGGGYNNQTSIILAEACANVSGQNAGMDIMVWDPNNTAQYTRITCDTWSLKNGGTSTFFHSNGHRISTSNVDAIQIYFPSTLHFDTGRFDLYGIKNS